MNPNYKKPDKSKIPRPPRQVHINDFQFYSPRLAELQDKEYDAHRVSILGRLQARVQLIGLQQKAQNYVVPSREPEEGETAEQVAQEIVEEQERIDNGEVPEGRCGLAHTSNS
jgi:SWI/SNF-related matrix-associated actin-dependent regulator of chromatin subfamily A member 5